MAAMIKDYSETTFITGMRAYAAIAVLIVHSVGAVLFYGNEYLQNVIALGGQGVSVFFVVSGYSVSASYEKSSGFFDYINKRFWRISPLYYLYLFVYIITGSTSPWLIENKVSLDFYNIFMHMTYLSGFDYRIAPTILGVDWTLSVEFFWYFIVPGLLVWVRNSTIRYKILISFSLLFYLSLFSLYLVLPLPRKTISLLIHWSPFPYMFAFSLGLLAYKLRNVLNHPRNSRQRV